MQRHDTEVLHEVGGSTFSKWVTRSNGWVLKSHLLIHTTLVRSNLLYLVFILTLRFM